MSPGPGPVEGDCINPSKSIGLAERYADQSVQADRYDPAALVNKGNILMIRGDVEKARDFYREAIQSDASCVEAMYNLGLVHKRMQLHKDALQCFSKLNVILRNDAQVDISLACVRCVHKTSTVLVCVRVLVQVQLERLGSKKMIRFVSNVMLKLYSLFLCMMTENCIPYVTVQGN